VTGDDAGADQRESRFHELYQANYRPVLAYVVNRLGPGDDAHDVVADVFTTAWRRLPDIPQPPSDRLWLYGTARRVVARRYRAAGRLRNLLRRLTAEQRLTEQPEWARDPVQERVLAALARLKPGDREALLLVHWEELSYAEAAQALGCSINAVGIRVHKARARLRTLLTPAFEPKGATDGSRHDARRSCSGPARIP
jgi:RNA polymerase sigma-70 factor (ECF subfamily)